MHEGSLKCFEWVLNDINQNTEVGVLFFVLWWWGGGRPNTTRHTDSRLAM